VQDFVPFDGSYMARHLCSVHLWLTWWICIWLWPFDCHKTVENAPCLKSFTIYCLESCVNVWPSSLCVLIVCKTGLLLALELKAGLGILRSVMGVENTMMHFLATWVSSAVSNSVLSVFVCVGWSVYRICQKKNIGLLWNAICFIILK